VIELLLDLAIGPRQFKFVSCVVAPIHASIHFPFKFYNLKLSNDSKPKNRYRIHLHFQGLNFCVLFKGQFWGYLFLWVLFHGYELVHVYLLIPLIGVITSIRRYGKLVTENSFNPFTISVMKDKGIVHILIASSSCSKL